MNLLWKLLREHISLGQLLGFFISNLVGTVIILLTIQIYSDISPIFNRKDSFLDDNYIIVSKRVTTLNTLLDSDMGFSDKDIKELEQADFTTSVGTFSSSKFDASISIRMPDTGQGISSDIFFESVPNEYIDVQSRKWHFDADERTIPIIMPRNYLNLYNFGFSQSQGLPVVSEGIISKINLDVYLSGNGRREKYKANIIGFSDRLNTILVPQEFLSWANKRYSTEPAVAPTRLVLAVNNPTDEDIVKLFDERGYVVENNKLDDGKIAYFMRMVIYVVLSIGLFISALSLYILMLSIFLLLEKNSKKLENLTLIGYSVAQISRPYRRLTATINLSIFALAIAAVYILRYIYIGVIESLYPKTAMPSMLNTILVGGALVAIIILFNNFIIRRKIKSIRR